MMTTDKTEEDKAWSELVSEAIDFEFKIIDMLDDHEMGMDEDFCLIAFSSLMSHVLMTRGFSRDDWEEVMDDFAADAVKHAHDFADEENETLPDDEKWPERKTKDKIPDAVVVWETVARVHQIIEDSGLGQLNKWGVLQEVMKRTVGADGAREAIDEFSDEMRELLTNGDDDE